MVAVHIVIVNTTILRKMRKTTIIGFMEAEVKFVIVIQIEPKIIPKTTESIIIVSYVVTTAVDVPGVLTWTVVKMKLQKQQLKQLRLSQ